MARLSCAAASLSFCVLACPARIQEIVSAATDLNATIAIDALSGSANQRAYAIGFAPDRVESVKACHLHVKLGPRVHIEQFERLSGAIVPLAIGGSRIAAHPLQVGLNQSCDVGRIDPRWRWWKAGWSGLCRRKCRQSFGFRLRSALGLFDLKLGIRNRLAFGLFDLLPSGFRLLL